MIESVEIQNFKNIRHQRIDLEPLTVFVGANGSGKTSVLEAIYLAVLEAIGTPEHVFRGKWHCDWLYTRGGQGDIEVTCQTQDGQFTVRATPPVTTSSAPAGSSSWGFSVHVGVAPRDVLGSVRSLVLLRLDPAQLARPSYADRDPPRVETDGKGLASVLAYMALNDPDAFEVLLDYMRALIPRLKRIRFKKAGITRTEKELIRIGDESVERRTRRTYFGEAMLFDFANAEGLPAHSVSEGTLMLLGLLTVLLGPSHPEILLMDDIERGLHPLAQKSLMGVLRRVMESVPGLQILATAHSPYLLDDLRSEEVRLMTTGDDDFAVCGRLVDHPQYDKWKDEMAPGEMWSLFGEKWLVQGVPTH